MKPTENTKTFISYGRIFLLLIMSSLTITSCFSVKPSSTKSAKNYFESFFVGDEGTQYFLKPLEFNSKGSKGELNIDFTFRYKNQVKDSVIVNYSITGENMIKALNEAYFQNSNASFHLNNIELLFNEKKDDKFMSRFTSKCSMADLIQLFQDENITMTLTDENNQSYIFSPSKSTKKAIKSINDNLFVIF